MPNIFDIMPSLFQGGFFTFFVQLIQRSFILYCASYATYSNASLTYEWRDYFSDQEKQKLVQWIKETNRALEKLVGPNPQQVYIFFHPSRNTLEPAPWANTQRTNKQGVHFYVNPNFTLHSFRSDWTAPHELSHLILPYLGTNNSWFAEGFASYLQYPIMVKMRIITEQQMRQRYTEKIKRAERGYQYHNYPFLRMTPRLKNSVQYSVMYWGGSLYFLQVERELITKKQTTLIEILNKYQACCRKNDDSLYHLVSLLDQISESQIFSKRLEIFKQQRGFPVYEHYLENRKVK